ncbi:cell division protein FtsK [Vulcanibacillus modesticaldus]|uniref:Cell division protein FtsK n=1 Tax=Vulcanibacillus modesticaldus TaxID=337097 RepID=A0A1D2YXF1_9BACI|nr:DNA translocase FtsK [Vulcanibacillus modesticaldus]OEG00461.1 cell division protein FtsK [Vulcanibacillus modesticaldus]
MAKKTRKRKQKIKQNLKYELYGLITLAVFIIEISQMGKVGYWFNAFFRLLVGTWDFAISLLGIYIALYMMVKRSLPNKMTMRSSGLFFIFLAIIMYSHLKFVDILQNGGNYTDVNILSVTWQALAEERSNGTINDVGGGMLGAIFYLLFNYLFDDFGTRLMIITFALIGFLLTFNFSYVELIKKIKIVVQRVIDNIERRIKELLLLLVDKRRDKKEQHRRKEQDKNSNFDFEENNEPVIHDFLERTQNLDEQQPNINEQILNIEPTKDNINSGEEAQEIALQGVSLEKIKEEEEFYRLPPYALLNQANISDQKSEFRDISNNAKKLEVTLESFGVKAKVTQIHRGPAVTRYEIQPDIGVKVSRIVNLADDIALSLAAKDIRIEAPIPGKAAIGVEVPNSEIAIVTLREVLESREFYESKSKLSIALGRDISGQPIIGDLGKMPHLLVAGATGSGKSVCINVMVTSILFKAKPSEVKLLMIDPKMVELNVYNGIPHLLAPVVTDPKKASKALKMIVNEMEKRYEKFAEKGAKDIERYNEMIKNQPFTDEQKLLPYIVVIIDELADLMMVAPNDVEDAIIRLAQKARAAGIHLIVATQRPSVDVITGLIKANIPSRIAFGVSSQTDSRTIIDIGGAEKLLGRGDMLFLPVGFSKPVRIQGAFISDLEVENVVQFVKDQQEPDYQTEMIPDLNQSNENDTVEDELFYDAVKIIVESNQASVSLLQRRLRIGYTRAARLIDEMEAKGIVGPYEGSKPRKVLITADKYQQISS